MDDILKQIDEQIKKEREERNKLHIGQGIKNVLGSIARLPLESAASAVEAIQGGSGAEVANPDIGDKFINWVEEGRRQRSLESGGQGKAFPGVSLQDTVDLAQNLGYSGSTMVGGLGAGVLANLAAGPVAGYAAGMGASGAISYRASKYQITKQYLDAWQEQLGRKLTQDEEDALKKDFDEKATKYALWEAIPEAATNLGEFKLIAAPLKKMFGKNIGTRFLQKLGGIFGLEVGQETVTQIGQSQATAGTIIGEKQPLEWSPEGVKKGFKQVAAPVALQSAIMLGLGSGAKVAGQAVVGRKGTSGAADSQSNTAENINKSRDLKDQTAPQPTPPSGATAGEESVLQDLVPNVQPSQSPFPSRPIPRGPERGPDIPQGPINPEPQQPQGPTGPPPPDVTPSQIGPQATPVRDAYVPRQEPGAQPQQVDLNALQQGVAEGDLSFDDYLDQMAAEHPQLAGKIDAFKQHQQDANAITSMLIELQQQMNRGGKRVAPQRSAGVKEPMTPGTQSVEEETGTELPEEIRKTAYDDLKKAPSGVRMRLHEVAKGVFKNQQTPLDVVFDEQKSKEIAGPTAKNVYNAFNKTRESLRKKFGDTIELYRLQGKDRITNKHTLNWVTKDKVDFFRNKNKWQDREVVKRQVPVDDIVAVNVGPDGKYQEFIVLNRDSEGFIDPVGGGKKPLRGGKRVVPQRGVKGTKKPTESKKSPVDWRLIEKKKRLEAKINKLNAAIEASSKTDMPGTFITGKSGVPKSRMKKVDQQLDRRIKRAKAVIEAQRELDYVNAKIKHQKNAEKRAEFKEKLSKKLDEQFNGIEVGDKIDVGGNAPLTVIKKNKKTVVTDGGSKWTAKEIGKVYKQKKPTESKQKQIAPQVATAKDHIAARENISPDALDYIGKTELPDGGTLEQFNISDKKHPKYKSTVSVRLDKNGVVVSKLKKPLKKSSKAEKARGELQAYLNTLSPEEKASLGNLAKVSDRSASQLLKIKKALEAKKKGVEKKETQGTTVLVEKKPKIIKNKVLADKLRKVAERTKKSAEAKYNQNRNENTARRARMAASARDAAAKEIQIAETMLKVADEIENGTAGALSGVRAKAHIKQLDSDIERAHYEYLRNKYSYSEYLSHKYDPITKDILKFIKFPNISIHNDMLLSMKDDIEKYRGGKKLSREIGNKTSYSYELADKIVKFAKKHGFLNRLPWTIESGLKETKRLYAMGLKNTQQLREAASRLIDLRAGKKQESPIKALEREIVGNKNIGIDFFPTPKSISERMVNEADISDGMKVLEPSGGKGDIADVVEEKTGVSPDVVELSPTLRKFINLKGYNLVGRDFLDFKEGGYDRIIMNPPFSKNQDIRHVRHAYDLLKPGGRIVAIMSEHGFFANDKESVNFRDWLSKVGWSEKLPQGSFKGKEAFNQTGVNARLVVIDKPSEAVSKPKESTAPAANKTKEQSKITSKQPAEYKGLYDIKWSPSGWVIDINEKKILQKYNIDKQDIELLRIAVNNGILPKDVPSNLGNKFIELQRNGLLKRKYTNLGPYDLIEKGLPVEEIDRYILTERGKKPIKEIDAIRNFAQKQIDIGNVPSKPTQPQVTERAWIKNGFRPIVGKKEIKRGKYKGWYWIELPNGKRKRVEKGAIRPVEGLKTGEGVKFQVSAWHGGRDITESPEKTFSIKYLKTGEGANAFGAGIYFTDLKNIAQYYAKVASKAEIEKQGHNALKINNVPFDTWAANNNLSAKQAKDLFLTLIEHNFDKNKLKTAIKIAKKNLKDTKSSDYYKEFLKEELDLKKSALKILKRNKVVFGGKKNLYKVTLFKNKKPGEYVWLDWDKPVPSNISDIVISAAKEKNVNLGLDAPAGHFSAWLRKHYPNIANDFNNGDISDFARQEIVLQYESETGKKAAIKKTTFMRNGESMYKFLSAKLGSDLKASEFLEKAGINGIRYPVGTIAGTQREGKYNYVIFNPENITIEKHIRYQLANTKSAKRLQAALSSEGGKVGNIKIVETKPDPRNQSHQVASGVAKYLGLNVKFIKSATGQPLPFNGTILDGTIYINADSAEPHIGVLGHEFVHFLKQEHPEIYADLMEALSGDAESWEQEAFDKWAKAYKALSAKQGINLSDDQLIEEFLGDTIGDQFKDGDFWDGIAEQDKTLPKRLVAALKDFFKKIADFIRGKYRRFNTEKYYSDVEKVRDVVSSAVLRYKKSTTGEKTALNLKYQVSADLTDDTISVATDKKTNPNANEFIVKQAKKDKLRGWELLLSNPHHAFKSPALKRMFESGVNWIDNKVKYLNDIINRENGVPMTAELEKFRKQNPQEAEKLNKYLLEEDIWARGYKIIEEKGKFRLASPEGKFVKGAEFKFNPKSELSRSNAELAAEAAMRDLRAKDYMENEKGSPEGAEALKKFMTIAHRIYHVFADETRKFVANNPDATIVITDENGKPVKVSLQTALQRMGDRRGYWVPRLRRQGKYVLIAKKPGDHPVNMYFDAALRGEKGMKAKVANVLNSRLPIGKEARKLKAKGYTFEIKEAEKMPESVYLELAGQMQAMETLINSAVERVNKGSISSMADIGIKTKWSDDGKTATFYNVWDTGQQADIMDAFGAERVGNGQYRLKNATKDTVKAISDEILKAENIVPNTDAVFMHSVITELANEMKARGARSHMIRRSDATGTDVWKGYEEDLFRAITSSARSAAGMKAKKQLAQELLAAMSGRFESWREYKARKLKENPKEKPQWSEYQKEIKRNRIDPKKDPVGYKAAKTYYQDMVRNDEAVDRVVGFIRGLGVLKYLGFRLSAPLVNVTALPTSAVATMSSEGGIPITKAFAHIASAGKAYIKYAKAKKKYGDTLTPQKAGINPTTFAALKYIEKMGWDKSQYNREGVAMLKSRLGRGYDNIIDKSMWLFGISEQFNRVSTILGTYYGLKAKAQKKNKNFNVHNALEKSKEISDLAHGVYSKANLPHWARGANAGAQIARSFYMFRTFSHAYLLNMVRMLGQGNLKEAGYMVLAPAILAGAGASVLSPFIQIIGKAFGIDDPEEEFYDWVADTFGMTGEQFARFGLIGAGGYGPSVKGSLSIGILDLPTSIGDVLGAPGNVISDIVLGIKDIVTGEDITKGFEKVLPLAAAAPVKAWRETTEGVTSRGNVPVFYGNEQIRNNALDAAYRALSFNPARIARMKEKIWHEKRVVAKYREMKYNIYKKIRKFVLQPEAERDKGKWVDILNEIDAYNQRVMDPKLVNLGVRPITRQSIKQAVRRVFRPPKRERLRAAG